MPRAALSNVSLKQLVGELKKRQAKLNSLIKQRDALNSQIEELQGIESVAAEAEPAQSRKVARKAKAGRKTKGKKATGKPLADYVREALAAAPDGLGVKDIEAKVREAGYPTKAETIYNPIMKVLAKGGFKKVGRGVYTVKPAGKGKKEAAPF